MITELETSIHSSMDSSRDIRKSVMQDYDMIRRKDFGIVATRGLKYV